MNILLSTIAMFLLVAYSVGSNDLGNYKDDYTHYSKAVTSEN